MWRWLLAALPLIILGIMTLVFAGKSLNRDTQVQTAALVGQPAPTIRMAPLEGGPPVSASEAKGASGPYLVNFFASWCAPCIVEHPVLTGLQAKGVPIVGVNYKDQPQAARAFLAKHGDPFVARLTDPDARVGIEYGVSGVPETFLISSSGEVLAKFSGPLTEAEAQKLWARAR
jgi:cytochrome c biogenesis protein CcmG, thiol:disulfide interchange protein DsbE